MELPQFAVRRFSVEEYHHLGAAGILTENERVELLEGWIAPKMIHNPQHALGIEKVQQVLQNVIPASCRVRVQLPITTSDSEPEPDVAVVRGALQKHAAAHPGPEDMELLVEVAESSLALDRIDKARIYARAGIRVYWIVNLGRQSDRNLHGPVGAGTASDFRETADLQWQSEVAAGD